MFFLWLLTPFAVLSMANAAVKSPCPKYFVFEPLKSEEDRWYGLVTLESRIDITGITLEIHFDKPIIQLGNWLGKVTSNSENTRFKVSNEKKKIQANVPLKEEIFVVYDPYYDVPPPLLTKILLNDREICPTYYEQLHNKFDADNTPSLILNINVPSCGTTIITTTGLITLGQNTIPGQWPWHAALYLIEDGKQTYTCGGTLISEKYILTAAHCVIEGNQEARKPETIVVTLGKHRLDVSGKHEQRSSIVQVIVHPNFNKSNYFNDISILKLSNPVKFTTYVKPICLWEEDTDLSVVEKRVGTAVGWGRDHNKNPTTDLLMQAPMPVVDTLTCHYANKDFYPHFTNPKNFCAGYANGTAVCNGDSGGGLVFPKKGTSGSKTIWQIRGIVSNSVSSDGFFCDPNYYVIFTDVAKYLDWIEKAIR